MKAFFPIMAGLALMTASPANAQQCCQGVNAAGQISVSATGQTFRAPDTASVSAGVVTQAKTAQEAMAANAMQMNAAFNELMRAGIPQRHIQTSQLSLQPRYDYSNRQAPVITGYEARNTVSAKTDNLDAVGPMLDALVRAGVNNINGVTFSLRDSDAAKSEARAAAVKAARRKAEEMAMAAGVRLGKVITLSETSGYSGPQPMMMRSAAMAEDSTPVAAGEQSLSVTVNITYAIDQ